MISPKNARLCSALGLLLASLLGACTRTTDLAQDEEADAQVDSGVEREGSVDDASSGAALISQCEGGQCQCADGKDNDGDDASDGFDPECLYSLDNDESSFATDLHDSEGLKRGCQDCFFDRDSKYDEGCRRSTMCEGDNAAGMGCGGNKCMPGEACVKNCARLTPNGCDCFGCCQVGNLYPEIPGLSVLLVESCKADPKLLKDPKACPRCKLSESCQNPCGECELCLGKTLADLPSYCVSPVCDETRDSCSWDKLCPGAGYYCYLGCCLPPILI